MDTNKLRFYIILFSGILLFACGTLSIGDIDCGIDIPTETIISMPSRIDKFGLMISSELTRNTSPM